MGFIPIALNFGAMTLSLLTKLTLLLVIL